MTAKRKTTKAKKVTVALKDIAKVCHICGAVSDTTRKRSYAPKNFRGPCGDSFCYASCDMTTCNGVSAVACQDCEDNKRAPTP